jgi:hypothetical protein
MQVCLIAGESGGGPTGFSGAVYSHYVAFSLLLSCLFTSAAAPKLKQRGAIEAIGCFTNVRIDGEHADGYSVRLWSRGTEVIGLIDYHRGLIGDPPMGILTDVRFDSSAGKISFKAKLSSGLHSCRVHKPVPSHDLLSFQGFLTAERLQGRILLEDELDFPPVVVDTRKDFLMRKDNNCILENYESYDAWWLFWGPIYKARGAVW